MRRDIKARTDLSKSLSWPWRIFNINLINQPIEDRERSQRAVNLSSGILAGSLARPIRRRCQFTIRWLSKIVVPFCFYMWMTEDRGLMVVIFYRFTGCGKLLWSRGITNDVLKISQHHLPQPTPFGQAFVYSVRVLGRIGTVPLSITTR